MFFYVYTRVCVYVLATLYSATLSKKEQKMIELNKKQQHQMFDANFPELLHPEIYGTGPYTELTIPGGPVDPFVRKVWEDIHAGLCRRPKMRTDDLCFIEYSDPEIELLRILQFGKHI